jgi:hypothetical protein
LNFTTGRYIDGKIQCLSGEKFSWICQDECSDNEWNIGNNCFMRTRCKWFCSGNRYAMNNSVVIDCNEDCLKEGICHAETTYEHSQNFTVEEMLK